MPVEVRGPQGLPSRGALPAVNLKRYIPGRTYNNAAVAAGSAPGANSIRLHRVSFDRSVTIDRLVTRLTTLAAGGNLQHGVYAADGDNGKPKSLMFSGPSKSTAAVAYLGTDLSLRLKKGVYWFATNMDNATGICVSSSVSSPDIAREYGVTGDAASAATQVSGLSYASTFGTWPPSLVQASLVEVFSNSVPLVAYRIASVG